MQLETHYPPSDMIHYSKDNKASNKEIKVFGWSSDLKITRSKNKTTFIRLLSAVLNLFDSRAPPLSTTIFEELITFPVFRDLCRLHMLSEMSYFQLMKLWLQACRI